MVNKQIKVIGLVGPAGAGKDLAADMICRIFKATNLSTGDFVRAITRHIFSLPPDFNPVRDQLYVVANYLRNEINPASTVKLCLLQADLLNLERPLVSGLRSMGEADAIRAAGGIIVAVDADPKVRYERIYARRRDTESQKTYEQFLEQDALENKGLSDTGAGRGIRAIVDSADILLTNEDTLEGFEAEIRAKLGSYFS